ncbi:Plasmodium vivax Vir protein, putative [Plasmodium vivax]|uniref:Vir protein, putative n=1 Tax=Plasmodium vivax TaxID=5855 RepID=A0A1G4EEJ4_PLAVI|nr:Plasmodium vivax Vir protein, putative [Plasmodium vivax]
MLYSWIYNSIDENKITENIVDKCFEMYTNLMKDKGYVQNCSKLSYDIDNNCFEINSPDESKSLLAINRRGSPVHAVGEDLAESAEGLDGSLSVNLPAPFESTDSSMKKNITTTIGTAAGATSLLVLLYKFSPGGNWIRYGFRGSRGRINDNLYVDRENDLFFNELQGENISSYDVRYNVGYGSS